MGEGAAGEFASKGTRYCSGRGAGRGPWERVDAQPGESRRAASEGSACILLVGWGGGGGS